MHDKNVRSGSNHGTLLQVDFSIAAIALVIVDDFAFDLLLKGLFDRLDTFDRKRKIEIVFHSILEFTALCADHLTAKLSTKDAIDKVLAGRLLQRILKPVKDHVEELLCVLLLSCVGRTSIKLLESEAESLRIKL